MGTTDKKKVGPKKKGKSGTANKFVCGAIVNTFGTDRALFSKMGTVGAGQRAPLNLENHWFWVGGWVIFGMSDKKQT